MSGVAAARERQDETVQHMTGHREALRELLEELDALKRVTPDRSHDVIEDAQNAARRLFSELGAVRDELGRLKRLRPAEPVDQA